jgi:hypothetical protein
VTHWTCHLTWFNGTTQSAQATRYTLHCFLFTYLQSLSVPASTIEPHVCCFHSWDLPLRVIHLQMLKCFDTTNYGLGQVHSFFPSWLKFSAHLNRISSLKKYCNQWGLQGTQKQAHTFESIAEPIAVLRYQYPIAGVELMWNYLCNEYGIRVSRSVSLYYPYTLPLLTAQYC